MGVTLLADGPLEVGRSERLVAPEHCLELAGFDSLPLRDGYPRLPQDIRASVEQPPQQLVAGHVVLERQDSGLVPAGAC